MRFHRSSGPSLVLLGLFLAASAACDGGPTTPPPGGGNGGGGGGGGAPAPPEPPTGALIEVRIGSSTGALRFFPVDEDEAADDGIVRIPVNSIVRWVSRSNMPHTVTPDGHEEFERRESETLNQLVLEHTFDMVGTYDYYCEYHGELGMTGSVIVF